MEGKGIMRSWFLFGDKEGMADEVFGTHKGRRTFLRNHAPDIEGLHIQPSYAPSVHS